MEGCAVCVRMCLLFAFYSSPCWILLKRRTGSGEREQARGTGNGEKGSKNRIENEVTNRARVQVGFCSHFSFSRHRIRPYLVLEESNDGTA